MTDTTDIVERLREGAFGYGPTGTELMSADEIERLRSQLKEMAEALQTIIARWDTPVWKDVEPTAEVINRARTALSRYRG
jgi:predicted metal-dependent TIM-barrel fold hydrolase